MYIGQRKIEYSIVIVYLFLYFLALSIISWKNDVVGNSDEESR